MAWAGGGLFAVVLVIASAFSCTRSEPELRVAANRPTTTTTAPAGSNTTSDPATTSAGGVTTPATAPAGGQTSPATTTPLSMTTPPEETTPPGETAAPGSTAPLTVTTPPSTGPDPATSTPVTSVPTTAGTPTPELAALPPRTSEVATARQGIDRITVYTGATGDATQESISGTGDYGQPQVFLVLERRGDRLRVLLPVRPNGTKGWIAADQVDVASHDYQIQVSLSGFQMLVQRGGSVVLDTAIGVGTQDTPTVGGEFYTWVLLAPTNSGYGSYAYGLSGFSTLEQFNGGDGRMGIHGTADQSSIGRNVSHGCVRVPDEAVVELVEDVGLPLGVPVTVTA